MSLQKELDALSMSMVQQLPADILSTFAKATEALKALNPTKD